MKLIVVASSIPDSRRLGEEVRAVDQAGADWVQIGIMDGRVVPNISFGPVIVDAVHRSTAKPLNMNLMILEPERYLGDFSEAGADHLLVQVDPSSTTYLHRVLSRIRELGKKAAAVLDPASPITFVEQVLHLCNVVLVMTVNPGFGGQNFLSKNSRYTSTLRVKGARPVDRGRQRTEWRQYHTGRRACANAIVAGSAIFVSGAYAAAIARIRNGTLHTKAVAQ